MITLLIFGTFRLGYDTMERQLGLAWLLFCYL